jgi:hypothetical protein
MRTTRTRLVVVVLALLIGAGGATPVAEAASQPTTHTPVMGANILSADQLARWYNHVEGRPPQAPGANNDIRTLAQIFIDQGRADGVRGDLAFVQSILETGWFQFPSAGPTTSRACTRSTVARAVTTAVTRRPRAVVSRRRRSVCARRSTCCAGTRTRRRAA